MSKKLFFFFWIWMIFDPLRILEKKKAQTKTKQKIKKKKNNPFLCVFYVVWKRENKNAIFFLFFSLNGGQDR